MEVTLGCTVGRADTFAVEGVELSQDGRVVAGPKALTVRNGAGGRRILFPPNGGTIDPGFAGLRQCMRALVRYLQLHKRAVELNWDFHEVEHPGLRQRLFGTAGGLMRLIRMNPEERRARAMHAARARYCRPLAEARVEMPHGRILDIRVERAGLRTYVLRVTSNESGGSELTFRSKAKALEAFDEVCAVAKDVATQLERSSGREAGDADCE